MQGDLFLDSQARDIQVPLVNAQPPPQATMNTSPGNDGDANMENQQSLLMGTCFNVVCCPCAVIGPSFNMTTIEQGWVGVVLRFGRYHRTLPPGRHRFNVMAEQIAPVCLKVCCLDVPPQEVMTSDNLTIKIDAVCYFKVFDAQKAIFCVDNYKFALGNLAQVTLRTVLGENTLAEIFGQRHKLNMRLQDLIDEASDPWGIKVGRVEIKGIEIDNKMQRAMAAKVEAVQEAQAKLIQAKAQRDASVILADAAAKMEEQPGSLRLQYMETLRIIATQGQNRTVIVPDRMETGSSLAASTTSFYPQPQRS